MPFGFIKLIWRLKVAGTRSGRMAMMGVRQKWQNSRIGAGLAMMIIEQTARSHAARGVERAELSWILDTNYRMKHMLKLIGATVYKRYRLYEKALS